MTGYIQLSYLLYSVLTFTYLHYHQVGLYTFSGCRFGIGNFLIQPILWNPNVPNPREFPFPGTGEFMYKQDCIPEIAYNTGITDDANKHITKRASKTWIYYNELPANQIMTAVKIYL